MAGRHSRKEVMFHVEEHVERKRVFETSTQRASLMRVYSAVMVDCPNSKKRGKTLSDGHCDVVVFEPGDPNEPEDSDEHEQVCQQFIPDP